MNTHEHGTGRGTHDRRDSIEFNIFLKENIKRVAYQHKNSTFCHNTPFQQVPQPGRLAKTCHSFQQVPQPRRPAETGAHSCLTSPVALARDCPPRAPTRKPMCELLTEWFAIVARNADILRWTYGSDKGHEVLRAVRTRRG